MKILIVSDTHRYNENFIKALDAEAPIDMLVHCGDVEGSEYLYSAAVKGPVHMVMGNNDFFTTLPKEQEFFIGKYKVFLTHGHNYYVSMNYEFLLEEAQSRGADIAIFGHIHRPVMENRKGILLLNPGSLTYPRQEGRLPSYMVLEVSDEEGLKADIRYINE